ncbi:MAG: protein-tyrosine phosphatase family protein [Nitrospiraceae bacterium]
MTEFPLDLPGRVFGSAMPFGIYDQEHRIFEELKRQTISVVVILAEDHKCLEQTGRNLPVLYSEHNLGIISLPICNYGVPAQGPLEQAIATTIEHARFKHNALIHCSAGIGRTAFFAAFLAMRVLKLSGRKASRWIGDCYPRALLTPVQIDLEQDTDPITS